MQSANTGRVAVLFRLPVSLRAGLQRRIDAQPKTSMNSYLEQLVLFDLASPTDPFRVHTSPTFAARGPHGDGRPSKGPRATILLRVQPELREQIQARAAGLGLLLTDYLASLVSQDISATRATAGEEMVLDQSA